MSTRNENLIAGMRRAAAVAILAGAAPLAAACGGSHPAGSGASSPPNPAHALAAYAQCMRHHGLPGLYLTHAPSDPNPSTTVIIGDGMAIEGANPTSPQFEAAANACRHLLPQGPPPSAAELHKQFLRALRSARCMRAHGYPNWPDPRVVDGNVANPYPAAGSGIDTNSPQFQAAAKRCGEPSGFPPGE